MTYRHVGRKFCAVTFATLAFTGTGRTVVAQAPDAAKLGSQAANALLKSRSLTFTLTSKPVTPGFGLAAVATGEGTLLMPDHMVFQGMLQTTPALSAPFVVAACGTEQYMEMGDGKFMKMDGVPNIGRVLFSADSGFVVGVLKGLEQASAPQAATVNAVETWHFTGVVPTALLTKLPNRKNPAAGAVKAEIWIGKKDSKLQQLTLTGPLLDTDTQQTSRVLVLSKIDASKALTVPRGQLPCGAKAGGSGKAAK